MKRDNCIEEASEEKKIEKLMEESERLQGETEEECKERLRKIREVWKEIDEEMDKSDVVMVEENGRYIPVMIWKK